MTWRGSQGRFLSQVVGPHFEALCRDYAIRADPDVFGGPPGEGTRLHCYCGAGFSPELRSAAMLMLTSTWWI
jgi:hypothetical protein